MAEAHPVGFQWVMEAKKRGATIIHVDPRFSRTSAVANLHVPIRAGADIAFVGGLINYVLSNDKYFRDYVVAYTNAPVILNEDFRDTEDLDGLFSGCDPEHRTTTGRPGVTRATRMAPASGARGMEPGHTGRSGRRPAARRTAPVAPRPIPSRTATRRCSIPRCVFQILKRHFARYTPDMVAQVAGVPEEQFLQVARLITENSGRDRTTAFVYSLGWTQHTVGVQYIRTAAILQTLLGNMGRPGGGILALRGHASIQGSTDIPTLFDLLPGYLPMPFAHGDDDLDSYVQDEKRAERLLGQHQRLPGQPAEGVVGRRGHRGQRLLLRLPAPADRRATAPTTTVLAQIEGTCSGYFLFGQNPAVGSANARMQREGLANLDWLVVRDLVMIESATWWKDGPEIETGEMRTEDIKTEVFFMPAAAHTEKSGSFTNTQRMLQWHHTAVEPAGDARSDLWFTYHLGRRIREKLAAAAADRARHAETVLGEAGALDIDRPILDLTWNYPTEGPQDEPDADAILAEINGYDGDGKPVSSYTQLKSDGSTSAGCWIYCGVRADGVNQADRRKPGREQNWVANEWGWAWPANRRVLYNRASADPDGKPWSERKALVWWDEENGTWTGHDNPDFVASRPPSYRPPKGATGVAAIAGDSPFIMQADGKAWLFTPAGLVDGPLPAHYEPQESPLPNLFYAQQHNPVRQLITAPQGPLPAQRRRARVRDLPLRDHHLPAHRAPHGRRDVALPALPGRAPARPVLRGVAGAGRRAAPGPPGLGDDHHRAQRDRGPRPGHPPDEAAARGRAGDTPDRAALALGPERSHHRGRGQRAVPPVPGPERAHPGGQGDGRQHPARPPAARASAARPDPFLPAAGRHHR